MKKSLVALYALLLTMIGGVPIAYAGCMDDVGDAVLGFFTGGVSYAVCQAIETVKSIIRTVEIIIGSMARMTNETVNTARQLVHDTANSIATNTRNAMNQLSSMVNDARRLAATPPAAILPPAGLTSRRIDGKNPTLSLEQVERIRHPLANMDELRATLRQGAATLGRIHLTLQSQAVNHIQSATQLAINQAERHLNSANRIAETSVMAPLRQIGEMLNGLLSHPERIFDPGSLVNETIERLTLAMTQVVERMHHEVTGEALATIHGVDQHLRRVTSETAVASRIHAAMVKAHQSRTQQSLDELRTALRAGPGGLPGGLTVRTTIGVHASPGMSALLAMPNLQQLRNNSIQQANRPYLQHVNALKLQSAKLKEIRQQGPTGRLPPGTEQRAKAELDRLLKGKTPAEAEQIKRNLKSQLQAKLRSNPKALAELDRRFDDRLSAHLRLNPALLRTAPAGRTGLLLPAVQK